MRGRSRALLTVFGSVPILALVAGAAVAAPGAGHAFGFDDVVAEARALLAEPYQPVRGIPAWLRYPALNYERYEQIRFRSAMRLWRGRSRFGVMLLPAGLYYTRPVRIHVVAGGRVRRLAFDKSFFTFPDAAFARRVPADLGYAGFELTYPLEPGAPYNIFLAFAGASYFRAVGRNEGFGLSARGIAIDTGLASSEPFPAFRSFWLVRPESGAKSMELYALLDGRHVTGAYRFEVTPGDDTVLDVTAVLYFRNRPKRVGLAPLSSMFFYGANTIRPAGQWRPAVHDSSGLAIANGDGEWLWRPLMNPSTVTTTSFAVENLRGFGLLQRPREFADYEDLGARYERRPNAWILPQGDWGKGEVMLVELPENEETEDNIVAFYRPEKLPPPGVPVELHYQLRFGGPPLGMPPAGYASRSFVGAGTNPGATGPSCAVRFLVNFRGGELGELDGGVRAQVTDTAGGSVTDVDVERARPFGGWRLSFLATPAPGKPLDLRAYLVRGHDTLTETWTYELPADMLAPYRLDCEPGHSAAGDGRPGPPATGR